MIDFFMATWVQHTRRAKTTLAYDQFIIYDSKLMWHLLASSYLFTSRSYGATLLLMWSRVQRMNVSQARSPLCSPATYWKPSRLCSHPRTFVGWLITFAVDPNIRDGSRNVFSLSSTWTDRRKLQDCMWSKFDLNEHTKKTCVFEQDLWTFPATCHRKSDLLKSMSVGSQTMTLFWP